MVSLCNFDFDHPLSTAATGIAGINFLVAVEVVGVRNFALYQCLGNMPHMAARRGPDYGYRTPEERKLIDARLKASLKELGIVEQMIRSSPDRPWVSGPSSTGNVINRIIT
jgi:hypothetical protein